MGYTDQEKFSYTFEITGSKDNVSFREAYGYHIIKILSDFHMREQNITNDTDAMNNAVALMFPRLVLYKSYKTLFLFVL